ncbi:MAG: hypothetical protein ABMA26_16135 [Limisphaerales bacterium]
MKPEQALACLAALLNAPVIKLAVGINDLAACDLALRTLAEAVKPKPEPAPAAAEPPKPEAA